MIPEFLKIYLKKIQGALVLEDICEHKVRKLVLHFFGLIFLSTAILMILGLNGEKDTLKGVMLMSFSVFLSIASLEAYFYSAYGRSHKDDDIVPFEIGEIIFYADDGDLTKGFIFSDIGDVVMKRLGFSEKEITEFIKLRGSPILSESSAHLFGAITSNETYAKAIYEFDKDFNNFLSAKGVQYKEFLGALNWVIDSERSEIEEERFWSENFLSKFGSIGKNWSYGETYIMDRYGSDITSGMFSHSSSYEKTYKDYVFKLESMLTKSESNNVIVISNDESSRMDVVRLLAKKIKSGMTNPVLDHKRIYVINTNLIIESAGDKIALERDLVDLVNQASRAENVVLVFPETSAFIESARVIGVDVVSVLLPYIESSAISFVFLSGKQSFHNNLESNTILREKFEVLSIDSEDISGIVSMLLDEVRKVEKSNKIFFTYPAVLSIAESAKRYFSQYAYSDKAHDILLEVVPFALLQGKRTVLRDDVLLLVESKTGVPTSMPKGEEKEKLLHLEEVLHKSVIGQDGAIKAISTSLRRSRAGIRNQDKPIGSFLFLGPTGVGKTETTKALAEVFFGNKDNISRLDMSEFKGPDALSRLIGSFTLGKTGILSTLVKERPYGVLLLDEFEKTTDDVHNLFLQILDEGFFTDSRDEKINVRNNIIIATSNAGSDLIWKYVKNGVNPASIKDDIVDHIIESNILRPELINRFDDVVIFHPLEDNHLRKISSIMLDSLVGRVREKGIELSFDESVISFLVKEGSDPKFGARPLNRAIAEELEEAIALKMIEGDLKMGSKANLSIKDGKVDLSII